MSHPNRRTALLGLASLAPAMVITLPASARTTRTVTTTQFAEIKVSLDTTIKGIRALAADCAREGDRWAAKWRRDAAKALREEPDMQERGVHWALEREYETRSVIGRYVSVVRADYLNTGGAHPNLLIDTILWDGAVNKRVSIRPFFNETADNGPAMTALAELVRAAVLAEKKRRDIPQELIDDPEWLKDITPELTGLGPVTLAPSTEPNRSSGLTFHFHPYAVGPYAEGSYTVFVPWQSFEPFLSADGRALFAGERPADDAAKYLP